MLTSTPSAAAIEHHLVGPDVDSFVAPPPRPAFVPGEQVARHRFESCGTFINEHSSSFGPAPARA
jgi:hypothetical protein